MTDTELLDMLNMLQKFEELESMSFVQRKKYILNLKKTEPLLANQLDMFFKNKKVIREVFYNEIRKKCQ